MKQLDSPFLGGGGLPSAVAVDAPRVIARPEPKRPAGDGVVRNAALSADGVYRWWLSRTWAFSDGPMGLVCMLNPSTANGEKDDPTIRTLIQRGRETWGWSGFYAVNLCALISPLPGVLLHAQNPIGAENDATIARLAYCARRSGGQLVVAWGGILDWQKVAPPLRGRDEVVVKMLAELADVWCLGRGKVNKFHTGHPASGARAPTHPLARGKGRIPVETPLELYRAKIGSK